MFKTTWKFAPSGSMCPPDVQNRVFTSKGARYAARTSRENPKLGRSSSPTMFNILLSNCCPHLGTALAPPQHYAVHCCLCTLCTHYIAACVNCVYSELYQQLLSRLAGGQWLHRNTTCVHCCLLHCCLCKWCTHNCVLIDFTHSRQ